jgi:hypothetical protein
MFPIKKTKIFQGVSKKGSHKETAPASGSSREKRDETKAEVQAVLARLRADGAGEQLERAFVDAMDATASRWLLEELAPAKTGVSPPAIPPPKSDKGLVFGRFLNNFFPMVFQFIINIILLRKCVLFMAI